MLVCTRIVRQVSRMDTFIVKVFTLCFVININLVTARKCIGCAHDPGASVSINLDCIGDIQNITDVTLLECDPEYGDEACFTMVTCTDKCYATNNPGPEDMMWNRGCCNPKRGDQRCPTDKPNHVDNGWYAIWRNRCVSDQDGCNTDAPGGSSTGGTGGDGGTGGGNIIVGSKGSAGGVTGGLLSCVLVIITLMIC